jgi:hypothetical protein
MAYEETATRPHETRRRGSTQRPRTLVRTRPREEDGRRLWSAGHALIILVGALAISLLLNAPGVHKRAFNMSNGWQRDVALALSGPIAGVSHALGLDRPREAIQATIGRSGTDRIDTSIGAAPNNGLASISSAAASLPTGRPETAGPFTAARPLEVWIAGDSLAFAPGYAILRAGERTGVIAGVDKVDSRIATGLTRPDVFNWFNEIRTQVWVLRPDVVVLALGANDDKAYMTGLTGGVHIEAFGDADWIAEYRRRVATIIDSIHAAGAYVVWLGLPVTADPNQSARFATVNDAARAQLATHPGWAAYVDTTRLLTQPSGGYTEYLTHADGSTVRIRASDGVHLESPGGDLVAAAVVDVLARKFDLRGLQK